MQTTVTKFAKNRFLVEGTWAVIGARLVNEPYARAFATKRAADADAARLDDINVAGLAHLAEVQAARRAAVAAYVAARAARPSAAQASFGF